MTFGSDSGWGIILVLIVLFAMGGRGFGWGHGGGEEHLLSRSYNAEIDGYKDKLAVALAKINEQHNDISLGKVFHRLDEIECKMLKAPQLVGYAAAPNTHPVDPGFGPGPRPFDWV